MSALYADADAIYLLMIHFVDDAMHAITLITIAATMPH